MILKCDISRFIYVFSMKARLSVSVLYLLVTGET